MSFYPACVRAQVINLIVIQKNIPASFLVKNTDLHTLGFDQVDLVDLILEVEKLYQIEIPDELPIHSVDDFVHFICPY